MFVFNAIDQNGQIGLFCLLLTEDMERLQSVSAQGGVIQFHTQGREMFQHAPLGQLVLVHVTAETMGKVMALDAKGADFADIMEAAVPGFKQAPAKYENPNNIEQPTPSKAKPRVN